MDTVSRKLEDAVHELAFTYFSEGSQEIFESSPLLKQLVAMGTELWIDTGDLDLARSVWKRELTSLTTNNTLANQVVQTGVMDDVIRETARRLKEVASDLTDQEKIMEIGFVINCKIALRLAQAFHQKVSVELHPSVSRDIEKTVYYGKRYYQVCPQYFNVKVPLTPEGYLAVRRLRSENIPINFTLGFSARQNYLAARLSNPNYVNVFLGRLNQVVVDNDIGNGKNVGEKVTWATQKALRSLEKEGSDTRLIGASIRNGRQIVALAGLDVLTIPPKAMKEFLGSEVDGVESKSEENWVPGVDSVAISRFETLWTVSDSFKAFTSALLNKPSLDSFTGEDLVKLCDEFGTRLFYPFCSDEHQKMYAHGKIPRISDWPETVALDDLMTQSALNSFAKDQDALDNRIRSFLS